MRSKMILAVAVLSLAVPLAACGDDDDSADETTTTSAAETTTTAESSPTTAAQGDLANGPNYVTTSGPSGSGCTPGDVSKLPAGWWAGEIRKVYESGVDFDLVCWYTGDAAMAVAQERGDELTNDYYVVDDNPRTFRIEFPPGMTGSSCVDQSNQRFACELNDVLQLYRVALDEEVPTSMLGGSELAAFPIIWIHTTADGQGDYAYMQFTP